MSWTDRPDSVACCEGPKGAVDSMESVARLLHSNIDNPDIAPFQRKELTGEDLGREPVNVCGDADGCSVNRTGQLTDDDLRRMSEDLAARGSKPRTATGAVIASVEALRGIRGLDDPDTQVVFVYDDPLPGNDHHAVLRVPQGLSRTDFRELQRRIAATFVRRVA